VTISYVSLWRRAMARQQAAGGAPPPWPWPGARAEQLPPAGDWQTWLILAGRGWGKTRTAVEWVHYRASTKPRRLTIAAPTAADLRDICVEGESGLKTMHPEIVYEPSKRRLTWPCGSVATLVSADEPERFRGLQHDTVWFDELAASRYQAEAWDQILFGLRLGDDPRALVTTTPRPTRLIRQLSADPRTAVTRGKTSDNAANLAPQFLEAVTARYAGTRLGRQELEGEILLDTPGALWTWAVLDAARAQAAPELRRVVVAVDPAASSNPDSDETGIVVCGLGADGLYYVLEDVSGIRTPDGWARAAVAAFDRHKADRVVIETNQGGEMAVQTLRTVRPHLPIEPVHASRGKQTRAEPIAALYEQGRVRHLPGLETLEAQLTSWSPAEGSSPDRLDALVWGLTALVGTPSGPAFDFV
jgi:predicted phage terminase large subunit-like protein